LLILHNREKIRIQVAYFDELKRKIQIYFGEKGSVPEHKPGAVYDLSKPRNIGMFFCVESKSDLDETRKVVRYARKNKEQVTAFVFSHSPEKVDVITDKSIFYFDLSDFTLLGRKKDYLQEAFDKEHFELMISFLEQHDLFCYKLVSEIKAGFKVGRDIPGTNNIFDLTLKMDPEKKGYLKFYDQVRHYLSVLKIKTR